MAGGATECSISARAQIGCVCEAVFAVETLWDVHADLVLADLHAVDVEFEDARCVNLKWSQIAKVFFSNT